jgi:hypothetical protein
MYESDVRTKTASAADTIACVVRPYSLYGVDGFVPTCREAGRRIDRGDGFPAIHTSLPEQPFFYPVTTEEYATGRSIDAPACQAGARAQ